MVGFLRESIHRILTALLRAKQIFFFFIKSVYNDKHFSKIIIRHWKKNIFKKCNFLIIIFFSQIAQATMLEKLNITCFPRGWHYKNISFCSIFSNRNVWHATVLVFCVLFSRIFFKLQRLKYFATCFPHIVFLYLFKPQRDVIKHFPVLFQKQIHFRHRIYCLQVLFFIYFYYQYYSML